MFDSLLIAEISSFMDAVALMIQIETEQKKNTAKYEFNDCLNFCLQFHSMHCCDPNDLSHSDIFFTYFGKCGEICKKQGCSVEIEPRRCSS